MSLPRAARLRARLMLLVGLAVVPALAMILYTGLEQRRLAAERARREAMTLASTVAAEQAHLISETQQLLALLSQLPQIRAMDAAECEPLLRELLAQGEVYANLGVIRRDGTLACSALPFASGLRLQDREYFRGALQTGGFSMGVYQVGRVTGAPTVNFGYPVRGDGGAVEGVAYAALALRWLTQRAAAAELPDGSAVTVIDPSLTVLARFPEEAGWVGKSIEDTELGEALTSAEGDGTTEALGLDNVRRLYAIVPLQEMPEGQRVHLAVGIPTATAYAEANRGLGRNLAALLVLSGLVLAAGWWGSEVFVLRRVRSLVGATRRLAAGDLDARAPLRADHPAAGELDELASAFNEMAAALSRREGEIQEHVTRIARLNRVYAVLSGINSALLRIRDRNELLAAACRTAVDHGQFLLALVHRVEAGCPELEVAARAVTGDPPESFQGEALAAAVCRRGRQVVLNDAAALEAMLGRESEFLPMYGSAAAFPLRAGGEVVGVLSLYAREPTFFDAEELRLLRELAADTSLGLEYMEKERQLHHFANYDTLTDLPNRTLFQDRLNQAVKRARQSKDFVGVLVATIDSMPTINATFGHAAGDEVLKAVAAYLQGALREGDTVARIGSSDLGVVLADVEELVEVETLAAELAAHAPSSLDVDGQEIFFALQVGAAVFPDDGEAAEALIRNASVARQHLGGAAVGSPVHFFSSEIDQRVQRRQEIERELRHAVEREELKLVYQPVVDVQRRVMVGVEALLRWRNPILGDLSPVEFIPVAEETGLISSIGEWIVEEACRQGRAWNRAGLRQLRINVNVSVDQLREADFVDRIARIVSTSDLDPTALTLGIEITESELMENVDEAVAAIIRFQKMGMTIYIDDFGTGYSSLSYLRQLPIDTLKIDASFIRDMPDDRDAVAVVKGIVAMSHSLGLRVVAEGVETAEQLEVLTEIGCESAQGYLFSRPVTPQEVEALLDHRF